ncbi:hypothetical protein LP420_15915 [Massilia sp. B-10]|nr:hypothetical protein LP420_15915 [Massilia sp. B-10]
MHVSIRVLSSTNKRAPNDYNDEPLWFDIIMAAKPHLRGKDGILLTPQAAPPPHTLQMR